MLVRVREALREFIGGQLFKVVGRVVRVPDAPYVIFANRANLCDVADEVGATERATTRHRWKCMMDFFCMMLRYSLVEWFGDLALSLARQLVFAVVGRPTRRRATTLSWTEDNFKLQCKASTAMVWAQSLPLWRNSLQLHSRAIFSGSTPPLTFNTILIK